MGFYENHNVALTLSKGNLDTFCKDILKSGVGFKGVYHTLFQLHLQSHTKYSTIKFNIKAYTLSFQSLS